MHETAIPMVRMLQTCLAIHEGVNLSFFCADKGQVYPRRHWNFLADRTLSEKSIKYIYTYIYIYVYIYHIYIYIYIEKNAHLWFGDFPAMELTPDDSHISPFWLIFQCIDKASERRMPSLLGKNEDRSGMFLDLPTKNDRMCPEKTGKTGWTTIQ